jgi:hypothetical protein
MAKLDQAQQVLRVCPGLSSGARLANKSSEYDSHDTTGSVIAERRSHPSAAQAASRTR